MAFFDEGTPRWETCKAGGTGATAITADTEDYLLVVGSKAPNDKYTTVSLTDAAADVIYGVTGHVDSEESMDPYDYENHRLTRVKRGKKLRCRVTAAYTAANHGQKITPSATNGQEGQGVMGATGVGRIVDGETIESKHYADFFMSEEE